MLWAGGRVMRFSKAVPKTIAEIRNVGFQAFPAGQWMDAMRGTKSYPTHVRCPYRQPEKVAAWTEGYDEAQGLVMEEAE
jgi:hypothetical protein